MEDQTAILDLIAGICEQQKVQFSAESATEAQWTEFVASAKRASSSGVNHPTKGAFWRSCQARLQELSAIATDPDRRNAIAAAARTRNAAARGDAESQMSAAIDLICGAGGTITPDERKMLVDEYVAPTGGLISEADLDRMLTARGILVRVAVARKAIELIPQTEMARLKAELQVFETDSLYAFLGMRMDAPVAAVSERIEVLKQEWSTKKADHRKSAATACLSTAQQYLTTPATKRRYEVSWAYQRLADNKFLGMVMIAGRDGLIDASECERLLQSALDLGVSRDLGLEVIRVVSASEGFRISEPTGAPRPVQQPAAPAPQPVAPVHSASAGPLPNTQPAQSGARPTPYQPAAPVDSAELQSQTRVKAAVCYLFPIMSLYLLVTRPAGEAGQNESLYFAVYQSLALSGVLMVIYLVNGALGMIAALGMWALGYQAYRGNQVRVPVISQWAEKKAA